MNDDELTKYIRAIPDFPQKGILFRDITPLLLEPESFRKALDALAAPFESHSIDCVVGIESRGFIFGAPLAQKLNVGFGLVRKPGKLPSEINSIEYELEYGTDSLEIHSDSFEESQRVLIVDDLLATGGTAEACEKLVRSAGGEVVGAAFLIELVELHGRDRLMANHVHSVLEY